MATIRITKRRKCVSLDTRIDDVLKLCAQEFGHSESWIISQALRSYLPQLQSPISIARDVLR